MVAVKQMVTVNLLVIDSETMSRPEWVRKLPEWIRDPENS